MAGHGPMRLLPSPGWFSLLITVGLPVLFGCSTVPQLWQAPVIDRQVEYITRRLECGPEPQIAALRLAEYEPIVIPSLLDLGAPVDHIPEYLSGHLDNTWWALTPEDWQDIDTNDIDKRRFAAQLQAVIEFYRQCIAGQKEDQ